MLLALLGVVVAILAAAPTSYAGHEHNNAPCWGNGLGDGADNDGWFHPYIHFQGVSSCGYQPLAPDMSISVWFDTDFGANTAWQRVYIEHCGYVFHCHQDLYPNYNECHYKAGIEAISPLPHHWHYHHYECVTF